MRRRLISRALPGYARIRRAQFRSKRLRAAAGSFALTGGAAVLRLIRGVVLSAGSGAFLLSGQNAALLRAKRVAAAPGSFALTGQNATLKRGKSIAAGAGSFALSGQDAGLKRARRVTAGAGSFALTGTSAVLRKGLNMAAAAGSFALTGQAAGVRVSRKIVAAAGSFALTGQAATLRTAKRMAAAAGAFALTGQSATLTYAAGGTFPVVAATNSNGPTTAAVTTHAASLPAGITAGDLLIVIGQGNPSTARTHSASGWTILYDSNSTTDTFFVAYKVASGSEGASVTFTASGNGSYCVNSFRITGYQGVPEIASALIASTTTADPPSLTPSWGSVNTLWIASGGKRSTTTGVASYPTNYSSNQLLAGTSAQTAQLASATRNLQAASEDPGVFTFNASTNGAAVTIAVRPA
ncbi:MAG: Phage protein [Devosia sp.]|uniref:hypothetical protein n=1 Tax=Devosia sp. TaxID=1871048 RepID=UPI0026303AC0|nr:hypothetical protein [Devosia sp.]MDB5540514.1 Phage protein [Devosia sp.]